jgi:hypothetical protein
MPDHPPAYCEHCKLLFPAPVALDGRKISIESNLVTCPKCHQSAPILDGTYSSFAGRLEVFLSPTVSLGARVALLELIVAVQEKRIALADARKQAERIEPRLAGIFDIADWSDQAKAILFAGILGSVATLAVAAATIAAPQLAPPPTVIVQTMPSAPPASRSVFREGLMSGTSLLHPPTPQSPKLRAGRHANSHANPAALPQPGVRHGAHR